MVQSIKKSLETNQTIKQFLDNHKLTQEEYDILFEDKSNWSNQEYSYSEVFDLDDEDFDKLGEQLKKRRCYEIALRKVIELQLKSEKVDLSNIQFINFIFLENLDAVFSFSNCKFYGSTSFMNSGFYKKVYFDNAIFYGEVEFSHTRFKMGSSFIKTIFQDNAFFNDSIFNNEMYFKGAYFEKIADFSNSTFKKLELTNSYFNLPNFNDIKSFEESIFSSIFENKETARIIKSHYEKHHNIIEANKYFVIEQDKYLDELNKTDTLVPNKKATWFVLNLNKYVSSFGTDWIRPLLVMFIFSFFATLLYLFWSTSNDLQTAKLFLSFTGRSELLYWNIGGFVIGSILYLSYHYKKNYLFILMFIGYILVLYFSKDARAISNDVSKLLNPFNIFKSKDYFEHIAPYSLFVKVIIATLMYQFIVAFRQNTRRK